MALVHANSVWVSVTSTGTGTLSLGSAVGNSADFTSIASSSQVGYRVQDPTGAWEVGQGTYTSGTPGTLSRDTVESSSNGGALVSLASGAQVFVTPTAGTLPLPALAAPVMDGTAALGVSTRYARGDHVHASDTSRMDQAGLRNVLINGNMDFWQRGISFTTTGYTADRWTYNRDGSGATVTISRQAATEAALLNVGLIWWLNYACTVAGSGATVNQLIQKIELVRTLSGRTVTLSFWAKATAAVTVTPSLTQYFGTGGSPSASVAVAGSAINVTTTPQRFSQTFTLPTISGKTTGSNLDDALWLILNLPLNALANLSISGVQIEPGTVATPIERRPEALEFSLCQRYYQGAQTVWFSAGASAAGNVGYFETLATSMRAAPTIAFSSFGYTNASNLQATNLAPNGFIAFAAATAAGNCNFSAAYTANAEL